MTIFRASPPTRMMFPWVASYSCWIILLLNGLLSNVVESQFNEAKFTELVTQVELDVVEFAKEVEREFEDKCTWSTKQSCEATNYDMCSSQYPNEVCIGGPNYFIKTCSGDRAENSSCSGLYSFDISTVRIPSDQMKGVDGNPTDPAVMEAICSTRAMDGWLQNRRQQYKNYWKSFEVEPRAWFFGSTSGAFRIWPAQQSEKCGTFDPRIRPWYVAGGSGPKNIILLIDTSGSMENGGRFDVAKAAATRIVDTLTVSDRITIIPFSDNATAFTDSDGLMFRANQTNKDYLIQQIQKLTAVGQTNFGDAFQLAFDIFDATINKEKHADCNSAILFLTDGKRTSGMNETELTTLVQNRTQTISNRLGKPVLLFTYSISNDPEVHQYPAQLACAVERGVWTRIADSRGILDALSSYYRLFALGLGTNANKNFVAWVEPYSFFEGNIMGTTVSVPVFDRSQTPHVFLGVVGVDISLQALDIALEGTNAEDARSESIKRVVLASDASCPPQLDLTKCEILAWSNTGDILQQCSDVTNCSQVNVLQEACPEHPTNLFSNFDLKGKSFGSRVCCIVNTTVATDQCPEYDLKVALGGEGVGGSGGGSGANLDGGGGDDGQGVSIVAIVVPAAIGGVIILIALVYLLKKYLGSSSREKQQQDKQQPPPPFNPSSMNMLNSATAPEQEIIFFTPNTNPPGTTPPPPPPPFRPSSRPVTYAIDQEMPLPIHTESSTAKNLPPPPFRPFTILNSSLDPATADTAITNGNPNPPQFLAETGEEASAGDEEEGDEDKDDSSDSDDSSE